MASLDPAKYWWTLELPSSLTRRTVAVCCTTRLSEIEKFLSGHGIGVVVKTIQAGAVGNRDSELSAIFEGRIVMDQDSWVSLNTMLTIAADECRVRGPVYLGVLSPTYIVPEPPA